jgi:hypothetical protein
MAPCDKALDGKGWVETASDMPQHAVFRRAAQDVSTAPLRTVSTKAVIPAFAGMTDA